MSRQRGKKGEQSAEESINKYLQWPSADQEMTDLLTESNVKILED